MELQRSLAVVIAATVFLVVSLVAPANVGAQVPGCTNGDCTPPPTCTNGDCTPPPTCTNGDCTPPPECTNGDCSEPPVDCCCVGSNQPGTTRVCCCRSSDLDTLSCRDSLVLSTGYPDDFHSTIADATLSGKRLKACNFLLNRFCAVENPGKKREKVCTVLGQVCQYRFCGPSWFPYDEPTPDLAGCEWWDQIYRCGH